MPARIVEATSAGWAQEGIVTLQADRRGIAACGMDTWPIIVLSCMPCFDALQPKRTAKEEADASSRVRWEGKGALGEGEAWQGPYCLLSGIGYWAR